MPDTVFLQDVFTQEHFNMSADQWNALTNKTSGNIDLADDETHSALRDSGQTVVFNADLGSISLNASVQVILAGVYHHTSVGSFNAYTDDTTVVTFTNVTGTPEIVSVKDPSGTDYASTHFEMNPTGDGGYVLVYKLPPNPPTSTVFGGAPSLVFTVRAIDEDGMDLRDDVITVNVNYYSGSVTHSFTNAPTVLEPNGNAAGSTVGTGVSFNIGPGNTFTEPIYSNAVSSSDKWVLGKVYQMSSLNYYTLDGQPLSFDGSLYTYYVRPPALSHTDMVYAPKGMIVTPSQWTSISSSDHDTSRLRWEVTSNTSNTVPDDTYDFFTVEESANGFVAHKNVALTNGSTSNANVVTDNTYTFNGQTMVFNSTSFGTGTSRYRRHQPRRALQRCDGRLHDIRTREADGRHGKCCIHG